MEGSGWRLTVKSIPHHQPYLVCYGFRLEAEGKVLAYTCDLGHPFELDDEGTACLRASQRSCRGRALPAALRAHAGG